MAFLPIGKVLVKGLSKAIPIIQGIGDGITFMSSGISKFGNVVMKALTPVKTILGSFITLFTEGPQAFLDKLKEMGPVLSAITGVVGTLASIWVVSILPSVVATVTSLAVGMIGALATAIPAIITFAVSMASAAIAAISTASAMTLGIGALAIAGGIAAAAVAMDSSIDSTKGKIESVDDGVISPDGNIISTHPEDFLIATKSPETLTNTISDSGMVSMDGVIKELRELKAAFISNKDVYIDNEKITSRISKTQEKSNINQFGLLGA